MDDYDERLRINRSLQRLSDTMQKCIEPYASLPNSTILSLRQSVEPIQNLLAEQAKFNIDNMAPSFAYIQHQLQEIYNVLKPMPDFNSYFSDLVANFSDLVQQPSFSSIAETFLVEISSQIASEPLRLAIESAKVVDDTIMVSEESVELISESFELPKNSKECITPSNQKSHQFDLREFLISLIVQLIIASFSIIQNGYYHKLDELSAKQEQIKESQYQEELLRLTSEHNEQMEQMNATLNEMLDYIQILEATQSDHSSSGECLCHTDKDPGHLPSELQSDSESADAPDNHVEHSTPD